MKYVQWGHGVLTVCSLYHGAMESLVLWGHDIAAAVLWIMINECLRFMMWVPLDTWSSYRCFMMVKHLLSKGHCTS